MAPIVWLLLAAGGAAALIASSKKDPKPAPIHIDDFLREATGIEEKFQDPLYLVFGAKKLGSNVHEYKLARPGDRPTDGTGQGIQYLLNRWGGGGGDWDLTTKEYFDIGYEYFVGTPYDAKSRISRIRAIIDARHAASEIIAGNDRGIIASMVKKSRQQLIDMGYSYYETFKSARDITSRAAEIAGYLGVDTSLVQNEAKQMIEVAGSDQISLVAATLKSYGPMAKTVLNAGIEAYDAWNAVGTTTKAMKWTQLAADLSMYVPVYGPYINAVLSFVVADMQKELAENLADCKEGQKQASDALESVQELKLPVPWHAYQVFHAECGPDNRPQISLFYLTTLFDRLNLQWQRLTVEQQSDAHRWWGVALMYAAHPDVRRVFEAIGFDASGGMVASDEMVMLVAAPIAVANGIDIDLFAERLWNKSPGWRGFVGQKNRFGGDVFGDGGKDSTPREFCIGGCAIPTNGWVLQWCQLAKDAFELAEAWPKMPMRLLTSEELAALKRSTSDLVTKVSSITVKR